MISPGKIFPGRIEGEGEIRFQQLRPWFLQCLFQYNRGQWAEVRRRADRTVIKPVFKANLTVRYVPAEQALLQPVTDTIPDSVLKTLVQVSQRNPALVLYTGAKREWCNRQSYGCPKRVGRHLDMDGVAGCFERPLHINDGGFLYHCFKLVFFRQQSGNNLQLHPAQKRKNDLMGDGIHLAAQKRVSIRKLRKSVQQPFSLRCRFRRNRRPQHGEGVLTPPFTREPGWVP